jgi:hypothetical protein
MSEAKRGVWSPSVTVPGVVGGVALGLAMVLGSPGGLFGVVGICGLLFAAGMAFTRWVYVAGPLADTMDRARASQAERGEQMRLDQLQRQLRDDSDPRTRDNVTKLRQLRSRLQAALRNPTGDPLLVEVRQKTEELYQSCLGNLERVAQQGVAAREMATAEARETVLRSRGELLEEVTRSVEQLGASIDQIQVSALAQGTGSSDLAKIRSELDVGLEVARRVQERMEDLDRRVAER